jgi:uncharacterized protein (TIGR00725 family)
VPVQVAVCGPQDCTSEDAARAYEIGRLLADRGAVVLCGGGGGVMGAAAAGARSAGGLVVGVLPGDNPHGSSPDLSVVLMTNLGQARNAVLVWSAHGVIVVGGSWGTLSELALARRRGGIPVVSLGGWRVHDRDGGPLEGIVEVDDPAAAVAAALAPLG